MKFLFACLAIFFSNVLFAATTALITDGKNSMTVAEMKQEILALPKSVRDTVAKDKRQLTKYATSILKNRRITETEAGLSYADSPDVQAAIIKARREAIANMVVEGLMAQAEIGIPSAKEFAPLAREYYTANPKQYQRPESIRVAHILFKLSSEKESQSEAAILDRAQKILELLRNGGDFAKLAKENSEDPGSAKLGGELPNWVTKGKMVLPFENAAFALNKGELSGLVRSQFGYHIIKLLDHRPAGVAPYDEVMSDIIKDLRAQRISARRAELLQPFEGTQEVVIDDETMSAIGR